MTALDCVDLWRLPMEMQARNQWALAGPDKSPQMVGSTGLYAASPVKGPWLDFDTALQYASHYRCKIGYILTEDDGLTCIDMDVKDVESRDPHGKPFPPDKLTTKLSLDFYVGITQFANSYTELSASGKGLHTWVYGDIGPGRRGKGIEVYSQERFIVCTGQPVSEMSYDILNGVVIPKVTGRLGLPIANGDLILQSLTRELGSAESQIDLIEEEAVLTDSEIWARATTAGNKEKFIELCKGNWQQYQFPTQSEADLALMSMFTFYSKSNEQCRRMFRETVLANRPKALVNDVYLNRTLQLIRSRQQREKASQDHGELAAQALLKNYKAPSAPPTSAPPPVITQEPEVNPKVLDYVKNVDQAKHSGAQSNKVDYVPPEVEGLEWPPGLVGAIAGFIYQSAPRPVKEVAIVAALGLMAGITGKAYNIGQTGLNLYIILIARSAIGKEAMHSGIGHILRSQCGHVISPFVSYTDYASGPALTKAMESFSSFVNVSGEWGRKLKRMADDHRDGPMQQLRTVMTNLYQKSGAASVMGGLGYSNRDQNVSSVNAVAYSMIGETTPGTFYDSLTPTMMEDGFLSRFNIIEYHGERPPENKNQLMQLNPQISDALAHIASHCVSIVASPNGIAIQVKKSPGAEQLLCKFNDTCDTNIRVAGTDESVRQIWNRAHLKAVRTASVLAASDNHINPEIQENHAKWAIALIESDAAAMLAKVQGGDIGLDDDSRFKKLLIVLQDFLQGKIPKSYNLHPDMVTNGIVPRKFLQGRTGQVRCYRHYRMGATMALDHTLTWTAK